MDAFISRAGRSGSRRWSHGIALAAVMWGAGALAQVVTVPAAHLHHAEGTVAWSPQGDNEWHDVQPRRLLKRGDRLWTDRGSRAEVQAGGHALRLDSQTQLVLENASQTATQLSLTQGSTVATVTRANPGDSFEVGTPNLAFRARQPGDYRIDVDAKGGTTRVAVISGSGVVYGERGEALELRSGQRATFRERSLTRVQQPAFVATDDFDRWAGARRRGEPTVRMPEVAQAASPAPAAATTGNGRTIIIAGPASALRGAKQQAPAAPAKVQAAAVAPAAPITPAAPVAPVARAQSIPNMVMPTGPAPAAAPLRVASPQVPSAQAQAMAQAQARTLAQAQAEQAQAQAQAEAQARARTEAPAQAARDQQERQRSASARQAPERRSLAARREDERRLVSTSRAEEARNQAAARREHDQRRAVAAKRAEQERRQAQARRAAEERKLALARKEEEKRVALARRAEAQKLADARRRQLARLQEQAGRDEVSVREAQARREQQARRAEAERREDQARREEQARREDEARQEAADRRQRHLADQWRRDQDQRREQEVWLRQYQPLQPVRPPPMGVPARRVS